MAASSLSASRRVRNPECHLRRRWPVCGSSPMSTTTAHAGGFLVRYELDPQIIIATTPVRSRRCARSAGSSRPRSALAPGPLPRNVSCWPCTSGWWQPGRVKVEADPVRRMFARGGRPKPGEGPADADCYRRARDENPSRLVCRARLDGRGGRGLPRPDPATGRRGVSVPALASKRRPQPAIRAQRSCCAPFSRSSRRRGG